MFSKKTVRDIDVKGKTVLLRAALNVPIADGKVGDRLRLEAGLPTMHYLLDQGAKLVLMSHHSQPGTSLAPVAPVLSQLLGRPVDFLPDSIGPDAKTKVQSLASGQVVMLENLRFHKEEEANDEAFAKQLAALGDVYVDDDFTTMHREHASIVGIPSYLPAVAGLQVEKEVEALSAAMEKPKRPLLVVIGGAKIATKIEFLDYFLERTDALFIGGAMANTFLAANGHNVGQSKYDKEEVDLAKEVQQKAKAKNLSLFLPVDVVVTTDVKTAENVRTVKVGEVRDNEAIADLGAESVDQVKDVLSKKGTVIWNGPLGVTEVEAFTKGSLALANLIISSGVTSIVGGGDTAAFVDQAGLHSKFSFISTGGGASLELLSGKKLPGIEALQNK